MPDKRAMSDEQVTKTLLMESHRYVEEAADAVVEMIGRSPRPVPAGLQLVYPPGAALSAAESQALVAMKLSEVEQAALRKVVVDACGQMLFAFFALVDGVSEPEVQPPRDLWLGAWITAPKDDSDRDMLHDEFFDCRHAYEKQTKKR